MVKPTLAGGAALSLAVALAWFLEGHVFRSPRVISAVLIPAVLGSVAYVVTLLALEKRALGGKGPAAKVLLVWLVICPLLAGALGAVMLQLEPIDPETAAMLVELGEPKVSSSKVTQVMVRGLAAVLGASWLLVRTLARRS
jgi:hypothetical protein